MSSISIYIQRIFIMVDYNSFFQFGDQTMLTTGVKVGRLLEDLKQFDDDWHQYNEFKPYINRQGLCILNEDGVNKPGPAISSLGEWNHANGTNWQEEDFVVPTPVYEKCVDLQYLLDPILPYINRTHVLLMPPGGYFPPHRDSRIISPDTFRLIVPLQNTTPPWFRFMIEDRTLHWSNGSVYLTNTTKEHMLFNAGTKDSLWIVINALVCDEMFQYVSDNLAIR